MWEYKIAVKKSEIEKIKLDWLNKQQIQLAQLVQSGSSNLDLLFVEKQILDAQLLILEFNQQAGMRLIQFENITGEKNIPENFYENGHIKYEWNFKHGKKHGTTKHWFENGVLDYEWKHENDKN